ncbi:DoxX family protein [Mucilaginibacter corticis]|uniref:DoxX family protein n=1 Tax=Mucilaginibacter corticis TaxID=2597670 RepID=A0A556MWT5_9SPHI|nr:DoxX family protein [Mucilaginibacter corticis]TSJ44381.1 DoxX family protein [Mucilaginibacter corticis]
MKVINNVQTWGDSHHPKILDLIRMLLGIFLLIKGSVFLNQHSFLMDKIMSTHTFNWSPEAVDWLIHYVTLVHMIGGVLIFLGLFTRLAAILQIPVVFGAVFFVNIMSYYVNSELWLSIMVLALLMLFTVIGSGPLSIDNVLKNLFPDDKEHKSS